MESAVDLHNARIGVINLTLKDGAVCKLMPEVRLTSCDRDHDRGILEVGTHTRLHLVLVLGNLCRKGGFNQLRILFNEPVR